jgi:hypothetical protein
MASQDALLQSATNPASIHRGLSVLPSTLGAGASHPLASGVLKLQLNLRQRLAALHAKREERDHLFLKRRAQYVRQAGCGEVGHGSVRGFVCFSPFFSFLGLEILCCKAFSAAISLG